MRVLVGPGRFTYDKSTSFYAYQIGAQGQNVAVPNRGKITSTPASVSSFVIQTAAHAWTIKDRMFGMDHIRNVNINGDVPAMRIADDFPLATLWRQHWHLDPAWTQVSGSANGTRLVFAHPSGRRVTITTTGRISAVLRGSTRPVAGWHSPAFGSAVPAYDIVIRSYGRACTTTFRVS